MYDRNVKSKRILTKLCVLDYEYICDRSNFTRKYYLLHELYSNIDDKIFQFPI